MKVEIIGSNHLIDIGTTIGYHYHIIVVKNIFQKSLSHSIIIVRLTLLTVDPNSYFE